MNEIQCSNVSFGSSFVRTEALRKMFYDSMAGHHSCNSKRETINAIESLLNDGKDDVIEILGNRYDGQIVTRVNGKKIASDPIWGTDFDALGDSVRASICSLAKKRNKHINLQKELNFENNIHQKFKNQLINYISNEKNSLKDVSEYVQKINYQSNSLISAGITKKLNKIAKQLYGENICKPFKEFD